MWRTVAIPAGVEKIAPASPTSAAPAPPSPAARVEPGNPARTLPSVWAVRRSGGQQRHKESDRPTARPPDRRSHWIRITFNLGTTDDRSAVPELLVNSSVKPAAPAPCWARKYVPDPARNTPLRFTALPWPEPGDSGKTAGSAVVHFWLKRGYAERNAHVLYRSSGGAVKPGRSET